MLTSLCVLSYERPGMLNACLDSIREAGAEFELIVHDDGSEDVRCRQLINRLLEDGLITRAILNPPGQNEGVGAAVRRCFDCAAGDVLVKVDQDLVFPSRELRPEGWLAALLEAFDDEKVGCAGAFSYHHDPVDVEKTRKAAKPPKGAKHFYVEDFVGSLFAVPRAVYAKTGRIATHSAAFAEDVDLKKRIQEEGYELSLPDEDLCLNVGFGVGPSTVVVTEGEVRPIHEAGLTFDGEMAERP